MFNGTLTKRLSALYVIFANVKTKNKLLLLRFFSALLCFHFLNISIETHKHFLSLNSSTNSVTPSAGKETESLINLVMLAGADMENPAPENNTNTPDTDGEEEEKKFTDDEFYFLHLNYFLVSYGQNAHRFHGVSDTKEFISEIIPPPPRA